MEGVRPARLKHLCIGPPQYGLNTSSDSYAEDGIRFLRTTDITAEGQLTPAAEGVRVPEAMVAEEHGTLPGDLLFSRAGSLGRCYRVRAQDHLTFAGYLVRFRPAPDMAEPRFLEYWSASREVQGTISAGAIKSTIANFNADRYANLRIEIPPLATQRLVADFLDEETARIDALSAAKQKMIEIVADRLAAVVARATASGEAIPLKRVVNYLEGPGIGADDFRSAGVPLIRISGMSGNTVTTNGCNYLDAETVDRRWSHFRLRRGDYVISASASMGTVAIVGDEAEGCVPYTGLIRFRPRSDRVDMNYIRLFLISGEFRRQIDLLKTGSTIQHFGPTHLDQVKVAVPPSGDQARCVAEVAEFEATARTLTATLTTQIALLRERRQALITAAVTGEIEI